MCNVLENLDQLKYAFSNVGIDNSVHDVDAYIMDVWTLCNSSGTLASMLMIENYVSVSKYLHANRGALIPINDIRLNVFMECKRCIPWITELEFVDYVDGIDKCAIDDEYFTIDSLYQVLSSIKNDNSIESITPSSNRLLVKLLYALLEWSSRSFLDFNKSLANMGYPVMDGITGKFITIGKNKAII